MSLLRGGNSAMQRLSLLGEPVCMGHLWAWEPFVGGTFGDGDQLREGDPFAGSTTAICERQPCGGAIY